MQHARTQPIAHLTKRKISHLSNGEIVRLADAVVGQFCYTVTSAPARRVVRVLWLGPQQGPGVQLRFFNLSYDRLYQVIGPIGR